MDKLYFTYIVLVLKWACHNYQVRLGEGTEELRTGLETEGLFEGTEKFCAGLEAEGFFKSTEEFCEGLEAVGFCEGAEEL